MTDRNNSTEFCALIQIKLYLLSGKGILLEQITHLYLPSTMFTSSPHVLQTLSHQLLFWSTFFTVIMHWTCFCCLLKKPWSYVGSHSKDGRQIDYTSLYSFPSFLISAIVKLGTTASSHSSVIITALLRSNNLFS